MSEENTQNLPDTRSFEERVFARFDAIDAGLRDLNVRVERLEAESERRAVETKPIWERALAEIVAVREEVGVINRKLDAIESRTETIALDVLDLRTDQRQLKIRMDKLDSEHAR